MLSIEIKTVSHGQQRYDTVGDWLIYEPDKWAIRVFELGDWRKEFAIAIHELVEAALCRERNISQQQVDDFDFGSDAEEPGDEPNCPYQREHSLATGIERIVLSLLNVSWKEYEEKCRNPLGSTSSPNKETEPGSPSD